MADFTAKDVQALRQATGAGMMDAKKALTETDGDFEAAGQWLREKGLAKAGEPRRPREHPGRGRPRPSTATPRAIVELKCETDFVGQVRRLHRRWSRTSPTLVAGQGRGRGRRARKDAIDDLKITTKENIELGHGRPLRGRRRATSLDTYLHIQDGRGVNGVLVELDGRHPGAGPRRRPAHRLRQAARTSPATRSRPTWSRRSARRCSRSPRPRASPSRRWPKIVEGRLNGWYKERVLLEQGFVHDEKQTVAQHVARRRHARPLRPGRHRRLTASIGGRRPRRVGVRAAWRAPAQAVGRGVRRRGRLRHRRRRRRSASPSEIVERPARPRRRRRRRRRRRQHLAGHDRRRRRHGPRPGRLHGHAGHGHQRPRPCRTRSSGSASPPGCRPPSTWRRWPSPTSGAGPSATSRRAGSSSSPAAPATRSSPPTPPPRCGRSRSRPRRC